MIKRSFKPSTMNENLDIDRQQRFLERKIKVLQIAFDDGNLLQKRRTSEEIAVLNGIQVNLSILKLSYKNKYDLNQYYEEAKTKS